MLGDKNKGKKNIKKAVALRYKSGDTAPEVLAKGKGIVADKIIQKGKEEEIFIYEDKELVENLINLKIGDEIPEELYEVVAEIIFYIYDLDSKRGKINGK